MNALHERFPSVRREGIVTDPRYWATSAGYEFWAVFGNADMVSTTSATNSGVDSAGWALVSALPTVTDGVSADFLSSTDRTGTRMTMGAAGRGIASPRIFGSYDHALQASRFLGYLPTKLSAEFAGTWAIATANETLGYFGFAGPAVTDCAAAGSAGAISSGGTGSTFFLTSDNGSDAGVAIATVGTTPHIWRIEVTSATTEWFYDDASQGTVTTEADIWPQSFHCQAGATNFPEIAWLRVWYS